MVLGPHGLQGIRSIALLVLDSLRWDSFEHASTPVLDRWVPFQEKRYAYGSWTQPSHACLLSGLLPYEPRKGILASATYSADQSLWAHALGGGEEAKRHLYPEFCLPLMAQRCGWQTFGRVAMPVLNENTPFRRGFDDYALAPSGSTFKTQIASLSLSLPTERAFVFMNLGETHYPYAIPAGRMPRISGVHGALRRNLESPDELEPDSFDDRVPFNAADLRALHASQIEAVAYGGTTCRSCAHPLSRRARSLERTLLWPQVVETVPHQWLALDAR